MEAIMIIFLAIVANIYSIIMIGRNDKDFKKKREEGFTDINKECMSYNIKLSLFLFLLVVSCAVLIISFLWWFLKLLFTPW